MRLSNRFACGVAVVAAALLFAAAHTARAQQGVPPAPESPRSQSPAHEWHFITVNFDYDFGATPPCAHVKPKHPCIARFAIYDTTAGTGRKNRVFLFNVPLPAKTSGVVPVTLRSPRQIDFLVGWHKLGVGALDDTGKESHMKLCDSCATWIDIQPGPSPAASTPAPGTSNTPPQTPPPASPPPTP